jgi:hypothetical protein
MERWDKLEKENHSLGGSDDEYRRKKVFEPKCIISVTMERDETGKIHANVDCAIDYLFEQEAVESCLKIVLQKVKDGAGKGDLGDIS